MLLGITQSDPMEASISFCEVRSYQIVSLEEQWAVQRQLEARRLGMVSYFLASRDRSELRGLLPWSVSIVACIVLA